MNYWIFALPREDMEHCIKIGVFGQNRKYILGKVKKGDKIACYITKEYKIIALGEATSDYYVDIDKIFKGEGLFPDRCEFSAKPLGKDREIDFMSVIDRMTFIKNLAYWSVYFRNGIVQISKEDWDLLNSKVPTRS